MIASVLKAADAKRLGWRATPLPPIAWWALAFAVVAAKAIATTGQGLSADLGDMDDATRLVQVREFMAGKAWFDTWTATMGGEGGMLSHWSRLIDLVLAALIKTFALFTSVERAEVFTRALYPLLIVAPVMWVLFRATAKVAGETAGRIALLLAALCPLGLYQFDAGRIDHHNVMIAATVSAAALIWAWYGDEKAWRVAGALTGLSLVIGYEALAPAVAIATAVAALGLFGRAPAEAVRAFSLALMAVLVAGFLISVAPSRWFDIRCDAISLNLVFLALLAGSGLLAALSLPHLTPMQRLSIAAAPAISGLALYAALEPKCLAGPLGQLPAGLKPIWLDQVAESRSILADLTQGKIEQSLGLVLFFLLGVVAQMRRAISKTTGADIFMAVAVASFVAFACWQYKYVAYASFIAIPPLARWISRLDGFGEIGRGTTQFAAALLLSQGVLLGGSKSLEKLLDTPRIVADDVRYDAEACMKSATVSELSTLPPGLMAGRIDLGAYIVALTPHRVLSAPYHRIADAIIINHHIFAARDAQTAADLLRKEKIDYVVICRGLDAPFVSGPEWSGTLRADLVAGRAPDFLEAVPLADPASPFSVWRMR